MYGFGRFTFVTVKFKIYMQKQASCYESLSSETDKIISKYRSESNPLKKMKAGVLLALLGSITTTTGDSKVKALLGLLKDVDLS